MLNRLLIVRLKAAENALKDGRLDEAFRLATAPDLREHRRGGAVLKTLADKLIERARAHFAAERFAEALIDLNKAEAGDVRLDAIAELRRHIRTVAEEVMRKDQSRRHRLEEAMRRVEDGSLMAGRQILARASDGGAEVERLEKEIDHRQQEAADAFDQAERLLKQEQVGAAIERFRKAKRLNPRASKVIALESTICNKVLANARRSFDDGRMNRSAEELAVLADLGKSLSSRRDLEEMIELARGAADAMRSGGFERARRTMRRLQRVAPKVSWVTKTAERLEQLDELLTTIYAGPLGESVGQPNAKVKERAVSLDDTAILPRVTTSAGSLPDRVLLLLDGGGSYLLLRQDRISIGRAMTDNPADVPILSDLAERHAEIARVQDDYFLFSGKEVEVAGRPTRHQLLQDGNRIVLAKNARFSFRIPHRHSASGVLDLSGSTKMPNAVRRVVLFRHTIMIGAGKAAHINCRSTAPNLLLYERGGRLWVKPQSSPAGANDAVPVEIGKPVRLYDVSFVLQPWTTPTLRPRFT